MDEDKRLTVDDLAGWFRSEDGQDQNEARLEELRERIDAGEVMSNKGTSLYSMSSACSVQMMPLGAMMIRDMARIPGIPLTFLAASVLTVRTVLHGLVAIAAFGVTMYAVGIAVGAIEAAYEVNRDLDTKDLSRFDVDDYEGHALGIADGSRRVSRFALFSLAAVVACVAYSAHVSCGAAWWILPAVNSVWCLSAVLHARDDYAYLEARLRRRAASIRNKKNSSACTAVVP